MAYSIPVILGTSRQGRQSEMAAKLIVSELKKREEINTMLVDPRDFNVPYDGNDEDVKDPAYSKITKEAHGFIIVSPEYNHSFPGSLKRLLDSELSNYMHKPVALAGVSAGPWGGIRAIEALVKVVREMGMVATSIDMNFPTIQNNFDEQGNPKNEQLLDWVNGAIDELLWMVKVLEYGRENVPSKFHN